MKTCKVYRKILKLHKKLVGEGWRARIRKHFFHRTIWHIQTKARGRQNKTPIPAVNLYVWTKIKEYILIVWWNNIAFCIILSKKTAKLEICTIDLWSHNLFKWFSDTSKRPAHNQHTFAWLCSLSHANCNQIHCETVYIFGSTCSMQTHSSLSWWISCCLHYIYSSQLK